MIDVKLIKKPGTKSGTGRNGISGGTSGMLPEISASLQSLMDFNAALSGLLTPCDKTDNELSWLQALEPDGAGGIKAKSLKAKVGLWTDSFLSCLGKSDTGGSGGGAGGLVESIYRWADLGGTFSDTDNDTFNAYTLNRIYSELTAADSAISARLANFYTKSEADTRYALANTLSGYVKKAGDTMSGPLTIATGSDAKIIIDNTDDETNWNLISFRDKGVEYGKLGTQGGTNITWNGNLIFHGGNYASYLDQRYLLKSAYTAADVLAKIKTVDGAASGLDADMLDGCHKTDIYGPKEVTDLNDVISDGGIKTNVFAYAASTSMANKPLDISDARGTIGFGMFYALQLSWNYKGENLFMRAKAGNAGAWQPWHRLAYTTDNVASADKLSDAAAFTAWGRPFFQNGKPQTVSGNLTDVGSITSGYYYLNNSSTNPYLRLTLNSRNWYVQAFTDKLFVGAGIANSLQIAPDGSVGIGLASSATPAYKLEVNGPARVSSLLTATSGIQIGGTADIGWYIASGTRIAAGASTARGVNVGSLLVSNAWADHTKVPANGIYVKGALRIGDITIEEDKVNGGLHIVGGGLYADTFITAMGVNPNDGSGTGGGGGMSYDRLDAWADYSADKAGYVLSALLGNDLYQNKLGKTEAHSLYQPKGSYVTLNTAQTISGSKTFSNGFKSHYGGGSWISMATRTTQILGDSDNTTSNAHSLFMLKNSSGSAVAYGGLGVSIGFYGFTKARIDANTNGTDWSTVWNVNDGTLTHSAAFVANTIKKAGGTSSQFLKADGSVDGNTYALSSALASYYTKSEVDLAFLRTDGNMTYAGKLWATSTYAAFRIKTNWPKADTGNGMPTINIRGYAYSYASPVDIDIVAYQYNRIVSIGAVSKGAWKPEHIYMAVEDGVIVIYLVPDSPVYFAQFQFFVYQGQVSHKPYFEGWTASALTEKPSTTGMTDIPWKPISGSVDNALMLGGIAASEYLTKSNYAATLDGRYVNKAGDTVTGPLTIQTGVDTKLVFNNTDGEKYTRISFRESGTEYTAITASKVEVFVSSLPFVAKYFRADTETLCPKLNADLLDGEHNGNLTAKLINYNNDGGISGKVQFMQKSSGWNEWDAPSQTWYSVIKLNHGNGDTYYNRTLAFEFNSHRIHAGRMSGGTFQGWKTLAFLDDNVASATKLQTARTLWGRSFDGTSSVSGDMTGVGSITATGSIRLSASSVLQFKEAGYGDKFGIWGDFNGFDDENRMYIGSATGAAGTDPALSAKLTMLLASGYIGLGTGSPTHRLHVNGYVRSNGLTLDGSHLLEWDAANTAWKFNGNLYATGGISALGITELSATEATVDTLNVKSRIVFQGSNSPYIGVSGTSLGISNTGPIIMGNASVSSRVIGLDGFQFGANASYYVNKTGDAVLKSLIVRTSITAASVAIKTAVFTVEGTEIYVTAGGTKYKLVKTAVTA